LLVMTIHATLRGSSRGASASKERTLHCFFLLDRSGSMRSLAEGAVSGFNRYVAQQKQQGGKMLLTFAQFDDVQPFDVVYDARDVQEIPQLRHADFKPRGRTPLYDSVAELVRHADKRAGNGVEVVVVIFSDGLENASRQHSRSDVFGLVEQRRKGAHGWTFVFLGANQDSYATGKGLAIASGNTQNFRADGQGVRAAMEDLSHATSRARRFVRNGVAQTQAQRESFLVSRTAERDLERRGALPEDAKGHRHRRRRLY